MGADTLLRQAVVGTVAAAIAVAIVFLIGDAISGPLLAAQPGSDVSEEVPLGGAIFSTVIGGVAGVVLALIATRTARPARIFVTICVVLLVLYGVVAFVAADDVATGIWLNVMHLAAAIPIVGSLAGWLQTRQQAPV
ncbi:MAG: DUF6069 family protein [Actinomycetota bacterium]